MSIDQNRHLALLTALVDEARDEGADLVTLRAIVEEASSTGAARALALCGLQDEAAGNDIRELRNLPEAWRDARCRHRRDLESKRCIDVFGNHGVAQADCAWNCDAVAQPAEGRRALKISIGIVIRVNTG